VTGLSMQCSERGFAPSLTSIDRITDNTMGFLLTLFAILAAGCVTSHPPVVGISYEYTETQDYDAQERVYSRLGELASERLATGMTESQVVRAFGQPRHVSQLDEHLTFWSYAPSISGTFQYWLVFVDGRLDFFGGAQTTWLVERYGIPLSYQSSAANAAQARRR